MQKRQHVTARGDKFDGHVTACLAPLPLLKYCLKISLAPIALQATHTGSLVPCHINEFCWESADTYQLEPASVQ